MLVSIDDLPSSMGGSLRSGLSRVLLRCDGDCPGGGVDGLPEMLTGFLTCLPLRAVLGVLGGGVGW